MWITLLIAHGLAAFMLLGAVTHQALGVWLPARAKSATFVNRLRAVPPTSYVNAIVVLFLTTMILGGIIYTNYRIGARLTLERGRFWKTFGAFELKEHIVTIGLAILPAYWYFWRVPLREEYARTRAMLTTVLAFVVWWGFLVGHLANNVRGLGT
jgi:hypothetical protein